MMLPVYQPTRLASQWARPTASARSDSRLALPSAGCWRDALLPAISKSRSWVFLILMCLYFPAFLKLVVSKKKLFVAEVQASEVFCRLLRLHLAVFPPIPVEWYLQAVRHKTLLNLGQQLSSWCSCSWDSLVLTDKQWCWYLNPSHQPKPLIILALNYAPSLLLSLLNPWQLEAAWRMLMLSCCNTGRMFGFMLLCCLRCSGQLRMLCLAGEARFRLCCLAGYMV